MKLNDAQMVYCPDRTEAKAVRIHNGTSWTDVWTNIKIMTLLSNGITNGFSTLTDDKRSLSLCQYQEGSSGSLNGGGTVIVYLTGNWTNPTITFDWQGNLYYTISGTRYEISAGSISIYTNASTVSAVSSVGVSQKSGSFSITLGGTYTKIGLKIDLTSYGGAFYGAFQELTVKNFNIGTQKVGFPDALKYNYN